MSDAAFQGGADSALPPRRALHRHQPAAQTPEGHALAEMAGAEAPGAACKDGFGAGAASTAGALWRRRAGVSATDASAPLPGPAAQPLSVQTVQPPPGAVAPGLPQAPARAASALLGWVRRHQTLVASTVTLALLLGLWSLASGLGWVSPVFLPGPGKVLASALIAVERGYAGSTLLSHAAISLGRVLAALLCTALVAIPVGLLIATSRIGRGVLDPLVEFIRPLPPLAYLPLVIIWFGIGEPSKVLVISLAMLAPIALSTAAGVRTASEGQLNAARAFGASPLQLLTRVLLPLALPSILTGLRIAMGAGWTTLVAAELVAATRGLGFMIQSAAQFLVTDMVIVGIGVISLLAVLSELLLRWIERRFVPWTGRM